MQFEQECQYAFSYRDASVIDLVWIREANRGSMQDVLLSLLQFVGIEDTYEVYIDGCDNYQFDNFDGAYIFAKKRKKNRKNDTMSNESSHALLGEHLSALPKDILSTWEWQKSRYTISYSINGDALIPVVAAASIIAKVIRDQMMCDFHEEFSLYGFNEHKGYGTTKHQEALINYGITPIHRKSYAPVKTLISSGTSV